MIVPNFRGDSNDTRLLSRERDRSRLDYAPELDAHGYRLVLRQPKYRNELVQHLGVSPTYHYLFELKD